MNENLPRIINRRELRLLVPYSPQHILRLEKKGKFPKRVIIGERRVGWWLHAVLAWLESERAITAPASGARRELTGVLTLQPEAD